MGANRIEKEYNEIDSKNGWPKHFQDIKEKSEQEASEKKFTLNECNKANNRRLNRYRDVSPYDHSRVILHRGDNDYINANLVTMEKANRKYILTQGPLPHTVGHFWLMVWEHNSAAILMLNKVIEKRQVKCHQYWPERIGPEHTMHLNDVGLTVEFLKCESYANFLKRTLRLTDTETSKSREVIQFHYTTWPDFCVPSSPTAFLQFLKKVRDSGALNADVGPAVVHCSAGIGRSGTFCLVDSCLVLVEKEGENKISVADLLLELRQSRMGLIQTADQLYFSYQAIIEGIKHFKDPSSFDYEEVGVIENNDNCSSDLAPPLPQRTTSRALPTSPHNEDSNNILTNNNFENGEGTRNSERPLPPLPPTNDNPLHRLDESSIDSDIEEDIEDNSDYNDDVDDDDDDDADADADDDVGEDGVAQESNEQTAKLVNGNSSNGSNMCEDSSFNADATLPPSPTKLSNTSFTEIANTNSNSNSSHEMPSSPENESGLTPNADLRRRNRIKRQADMEAKIKDIKRKQKESEAAAEAAPKKRRCLMIFSGVVVCVICCAYVYTKLG